jgi:hypothetical protein
MVRAKNSGCCCCSKCGVPLPPIGGKCCQCICDKICVEVTDLDSTGTEAGDPCNCDQRIIEVEWSESDCAYVTELTCGSLVIDAKFEVKQCGDEPEGTGTGTSDSNCHLCLTSDCLGLTGQCPDEDIGSGTSCKKFQPGHPEDCGDYLVDCEQSGGFNHTWTVNAENCDSAGTGNDCSNIQIRAYCYGRVNPAGRGEDRICKDCDCVCACLEVIYEESGGDPQISYPCWGTITGTEEGWTTTFGEGSDEQTISISLVRGEDGCCYWSISVSRGTIDGYGSDTALEKTGCPNFAAELGIDLGGGDSATLEINCAPCEVSEEGELFSCYCRWVWVQTDYWEPGHTPVPCGGYWKLDVDACWASFCGPVFYCAYPCCDEDDPPAEDDDYLYYCTEFTGTCVS